jgi:transcriptional regulator with XRE-family HTH domain|tara:strand:+ start:395 stop:1093 length:699 start_codon:yes stop_codon:yes gene_type:complete
MDRKDLFDDLFSEREKHPLGKYEPENKKYIKENLPVKYSTPEAQKRLKKTFKKLRHKAIYLNMEHEELLEKFEEIRRQFIAKMLEYCDNKKIHHPFESVPDIKKNSNQLSNKEMNEVFREVVKQTHPDLNKNLSDDELNERVDMYNQVTEGKQNGDFRKILKVALELNIDIKKISPQIIDHLRKEIQNMWKQMQQIKNDVMYKWYESDEETRKTMFEIITKDLKPLDSSSDE